MELLHLSALDVHTDRSGCKLIAWLVGGERFDFKPPFTPFYYSKTPCPSVAPIPSEFRLLSELGWVDGGGTPIWKCEAPCIYDLRGYAKDDDGLVEDMPLVERLVAEGGFDQSPLDFSELKVLEFDVRCIMSKGCQFSFTLTNKTSRPLCPLRITLF